MGDAIPRPDVQQLRSQGLADYRAGRLAEAEAAFRQAVSLSPQSADPAIELGIVLHTVGRTDESIEQYRKAIALNPASPEAWSNLGLSLRSKGMHEDALEALGKAISLRPGFLDPVVNLASLLQGLGRFGEAAPWFEQATRLKPADADLFNALGATLWRARRLTGAIEALRRAAELRPGAADIRNNLGGALAEQGRLSDAIEQYRAAVALDPNYAAAFYNLATSLQQLGDFDEAIDLHRRAIAIRPDFFHSWSNLALGLRTAGRMQESIEAHRRAFALQPDVKLANNLLLVMQSHPDYGPADIKQELDVWNHHFAQPLRATIRAYDNDRNADRRLRIGYVSRYLDSHPAGRFLLPLLSHHNHERFEIYCYSDVESPDQMTGRLRGLADGWHETTKMSDEELAELVRADRIDILVDLGMHTRDNRLLAFARKQAPLQVTYLAYCGSTGLETIDYRLSDPYLDPDDSDQKYYSEKTVRLRSYWCYPEPPEATEVNPLPALTARYVTFGCFNEILKLNEITLATWAEVLKAVPNSRLIAHAPQKYDRPRISRALAAAGVDPGRVDFFGMLPMPDYFRQYHLIDIALDPTPWPGGTTTCDALWMGVPVVSVVGKTALSRGGMSILSNIGLPELVGRDCAQQVRIAADLSADIPRLTSLRSTLRQQMRTSPLMDAPGFANDFEAVLGGVWRKWCKSSGE